MISFQGGSLLKVTLKKFASAGVYDTSLREITGKTYLPWFSLS